MITVREMFDDVDDDLRWLHVTVNARAWSQNTHVQRLGLSLYRVTEQGVVRIIRDHANVERSAE